MPFPQVPSASKSEIKRAGETLIGDTEYIGAVEHARRLLSEWRACHLYPLDRVAEELQAQLESLGIDGLIGLRLKRLFRIVEKLRGQQNMSVTRMQDIAGLRAIVPTISDVSGLVDYLSKNHLASAQVQKITNYIDQPKPSGYRSVHLILRYQEQRESPYNGLQIELQVRSSLQHLWASAVEINGMKSGQRVKYDEGSPGWQEFFRLAAELLAKREGTAASEQYQSMSEDALREQLQAVNEQIQGLDVLRGDGSSLPVVDLLDRRGKPLRTTLLLEPDLIANRLSIRSYGADQQEAALLAYAEAEDHVTFSEKSLAPVLVSVSSTERVRDAYRSFFMDVQPFIQCVEEFLQPPPHS